MNYRDAFCLSSFFFLNKIQVSQNYETVSGEATPIVLLSLQIFQVLIRVVMQGEKNLKSPFRLLSGTKKSLCRHLSGKTKTAIFYTLVI